MPTLPMTVLRPSVNPEGDRHTVSPCRTACTGVVAILGHPGGRPPRVDVLVVDEAAMSLRSSASPEADCHRGPAQWTGTSPMLRSSVAPKGDRHQLPRLGADHRHPVAILGRSGRQPPDELDDSVPVLPIAAILGCPERRPSPGLHAVSGPGLRVAILGRPEGNRHLQHRSRGRGRACGFDPRSP
jgi:hypothetical protein